MSVTLHIQLPVQCEWKFWAGVESDGIGNIRQLDGRWYCLPEPKYTNDVEMLAVFVEVDASGSTQEPYRFPIRAMLKKPFPRVVAGVGWDLGEVALVLQSTEYGRCAFTWSMILRQESVSGVKLVISEQVGFLCEGVASLEPFGKMRPVLQQGVKVVTDIWFEQSLREVRFKRHGVTDLDLVKALIFDMVPKRSELVWSGEGDAPIINEILAFGWRNQMDLCVFGWYLITHIQHSALLSSSVPDVSRWGQPFLHGHHLVCIDKFGESTHIGSCDQDFMVSEFVLPQHTPPVLPLDKELVTLPVYDHLEDQVVDNDEVPEEYKGLAYTTIRYPYGDTETVRVRKVKSSWNLFTFLKNAT